MAVNCCGMHFNRGNNESEGWQFWIDTKSSMCLPGERVWEEERSARFLQGHLLLLWGTQLCTCVCIKGPHNPASKSLDFGGTQEAWVLVPTLPLIRWVSLGMKPHLSELQFNHLSNEHHTSVHPTGSLGELKEVMSAKLRARTWHGVNTPNSLAINSALF